MASNSWGGCLAFVSPPQRISEDIVKEQHMSSYFQLLSTLPRWFSIMISNAKFPQHNCFPKRRAIKSRSWIDFLQRAVLPSPAAVSDSASGLQLPWGCVSSSPFARASPADKQRQQVWHLLQKTALKFHHSDAKEYSPASEVTYFIQGQAKQALLPELAWARTFPS